VKHLLVTNDFPPKIGGIQSYLWELWRRLPSAEASVLTTPHAGAAAFDQAAPIHIERIDQPVMLPTRALARRIDETADRLGAELVLLDPALPVGHLGPKLAKPYGVILHGAEITVPGRVPGPRHALARVLRGAEIVIAAGGYPADEGERAARRGLPIVVIPPGVDTDRFVPVDAPQRAAVREQFGVAPESTLVVSVSRLVPRKGMDVLIRAAARLAPAHPELEVVIGGSGRDRDRLERLVAELAAPVRLVGRVDDDDLPGLYGAADVFAMDCRNRWLGLEQEGFGIVFLEAAACGVPQIAG
jgi:phosphatidylinositol alpha-1,6-mannosyltransferase